MWLLAAAYIFCFIIFLIVPTLFVTGFFSTEC